METEIFLVRHGESVSNVENRFVATPPGPGLTEKGVRQSEAACRIVLARAPHIGRIFSSPLQRAIETAAPLCDRTAIVPEVRAGLAETAFGAWDGRTAEELRGVSQFDAWCADPEAFPPPGGEALSQVGGRVMDALTRIARNSDGQTIAAFTHMHPLVWFLRATVGQPYGRVEWLPNCAIVRARWDGRAFHFLSLDLAAAQPSDKAGRAVG